MLIMRSAGSTAPLARRQELDPVFGDFACLAEMRKVQVKGNLVRAHARWVRERCTAQATAELADALPAEARAYLLDPPLVSEWCPFGPLMDLDRALILGPLGGDHNRVVRF